MRQQHPGLKKAAIAPLHRQAQPSIQSSLHPTLQLQAAIGNREVNRALSAGQQPTSTKPRFQGLSRELAGESTPTTPIQAQLAIGQPGDRYEREADRVARQIVNQIHAPQSSTPGETVQRQEEEDTRPMTPLMPSSARSASATPELETEIGRSRGEGQPLTESVRQPMERAFGVDFSGVKVHADARADRLNRSIQAKAFTTGQDVFFRQGTYQPGSRGGQELIAHELTHVVQQTEQAVTGLPSSGSFFPSNALIQGELIQRVLDEEEPGPLTYNDAFHLELNRLTANILDFGNRFNLDLDPTDAYEISFNILRGLESSGSHLQRTSKVTQAGRKDKGRTIVAHEGRLEESATEEEIGNRAAARGEADRFSSDPKKRHRYADVYTNDQRPKREEHFFKAQQALLDYVGSHADARLTDVIFEKIKRSKGEKIPMCFWSGTGAMEAAKKDNPNGIVLEATIGSWFDNGSPINLETLSGIPNRIDLWATISEIYARKAVEYQRYLDLKGYVGIGADVPQNIFNQIESPTVTQVGTAKFGLKPHITWHIVESRLVKIDKDTGKETWKPTGRILPVANRDTAIAMVELASEQGYFDSDYRGSGWDYRIR